MRLLVVTQYFWPENFRINDLVSELVRRGHDITVLTGKPNYPEGSFFPDYLQNPERFDTYQGAHVIRVPIFARGKHSFGLFLNYLSFALSATLFGILRLSSKQFDAIFVFEPSPITVGLPAIALRFFKRWPIAFWVLDQWPETLSAVGMIRSQFILQQVGRLTTFIYARCDLILAQSKSLVIQIGKYCRDQGRISYFPNWVESAYDDAVSIAPKVSIQMGSFNVMFAGNIGEAQDFPAILNAAESLASYDNIRWLIVGDGRMTSWVRSEVIRRGLQKKFILLGKFSPDRMPSLYKCASALLVSLRSDPIFSMTIPGKLQSYLASSMPVLGMLDGDGAKVIEEAGAGLTCPAGNSKKLAEAILKMTAMTDCERSKMGSNGKAYSQREFGRDVLIKKLEILLENITIKHTHYP